MIWIRSKSNYIIRRSPLLIHLSLWGNFIELSSILSYFSTIDLHNDINETTALQDSGTIIGHCLFYLPYILRSYRLSLVFNLERDWDKDQTKFIKRIPQTRQKWQLKMLLILMIFPLTLCVLLFASTSIRNFFPISNNTGIDDNIAVGIFIFITFIEQSMLIYIVDKLRNIEDRFNMCNELIWVCCFWSISPIFSAFIQSNKTTWFSSCIIRNLLVLIRSDITLVIFSFKSLPFSESLTIEMLNSLEIILQNEKTLEYFEKYLKNEPNYLAKDSGYSLLCFYKEIECKIHKFIYAEPSISDDIDPSRYSTLVSFVRIEKKTGKEYLKKYKELLFRILNEKFYPNFLRSEECKELRRIISKDEMICYRIMQTSFTPVNLPREPTDFVLEV